VADEVIDYGGGVPGAVRRFIAIEIRIKQ